MFLLSLALAMVVSGLGFRWARNTMTRRLRYVDAAQGRFAPLIAGALATLALIPFTWLPLVASVAGLGTAIAGGLGVGLGVAAARREISLATYQLDR
jgi:hypothetical protein